MHRGHGRLDVVLEGLLDAARERGQHEHCLEVLPVQDLHSGIAVLVLRMLAQPVDLHQRRRVHALRDLAAEQQIEATRFDDRVERRVRDEVVDLFAHDGPSALAVLHHLHTAALELLGQVPGAGVESFRSSGCRHRSPCNRVSWRVLLQRRKVGRTLFEETRDAFDEVGSLHGLVHQLFGAVAGFEDIAHGVCVHLLFDHR